jgi:diguanylate cyclase (GGDEF)-like protein
MAVWYFGKPRIPHTGLVLSFGALLVPVVGTFWFPEASGEYEALLWLVALIPAFLLAYYRGWVGVAVAMLVGMILLTAVQIAVILLEFQTNWVLLLAVVGAYISIGLSTGLVSELLHQERAKAERLALLDDLTGIPNRRLADLFIAKEFAAAERGRPLTLVLFDIDRFKDFNDRYGHAAGDAALRRFVRILGGHTRRMDLCARYGGEEFVAILSGAQVDAGVQFAERIRAALHVAIREREGAESGMGVYTVSAGVAEFDPDMKDPTELVAAADRAMYRAKADGRDRVRAEAPGSRASVWSAQGGT